MAKVPRPESGQTSAHESPDDHNIVIEGIPIDFNSDGIPRIRDLDLAVKLGYKRPRKIREIIGRLIDEGAMNDVHVRPMAGRRPTVGRTVSVDEYWLTEEQALFVSAKSGTQVATELLKSVIRVFVLARHGQLGAHPLADPPELPPPRPQAREPPEPAELAAAAELLGGIDPRVRAALRKLPPPRRPSVEHWLGQARELAQLVERSDVPLPADSLACARLASSLILATSAVPDHPLVLGTREDLRRTLALIDRLLTRAACDLELEPRVTDLRARWLRESAHLTR